MKWKVGPQNLEKCPREARVYINESPPIQATLVKLSRGTLALT